MSRGRHSAPPPERPERLGRRGGRHQEAERRPGGPPASPSPPASPLVGTTPSQERSERRRVGLLLLGLVVAVAAAGTTWALAGRAPGSATAPRALIAAAEPPAQDTLLLIRHDGDGSPATGMTLLAAGPEEGSGVVVFVPVGTLADIPGVGPDRLGNAQQYGGPVLAQATVENLLGITIDHVASVDPAGLGALLERTGGFTVEVPTRLVVRRPDGSAVVRFEAGEQFLDGPRLAEYWGFVAGGEDELASFARQQQVLGRLLVEIHDPEVLAAVFGDGAPQLDTTAGPAQVEDMFGMLATANAEEGLRMTLLPVEAFGGPGPEGASTFRPRPDGIAELVAADLANSVPGDRESATVRVQVLNGVGVPGVGQLVDRRLGGGGFRIVLTDNARDFDFADTRILVYDESAASMAIAQRVRERLGVGTIQVSRQLQSVVDVTIVVGADFLDVESTRSSPTPVPDEE